VIDRRAFVAGMAAVMAAPHTAQAQQAGKLWRIGFLRNGPPPATFIEGLRHGLRDLGYVEGKNIALEYGLAETADQLPRAATDLLRRNVDVLLASGTPPTVAAKRATDTIPIVSHPSTRLRQNSLLASPGRAETSPASQRPMLISWESDWSCSGRPFRNSFA
jgi:hypothetical protein